MSVAGTISSRMLLVNEEKVTRCGVRWHVSVFVCLYKKLYVLRFVPFFIPFRCVPLCVCGVFFHFLDSRDVHIFLHVYCCEKELERMKMGTKTSALGLLKEKELCE